MIYQQSCKVLPGGVNSPVRSFRHLRMEPLVAESAQGAYLFDADGNRYIDYCCSWGSLILGHAHPQVVQATCEQIQKGSSFGVTTEIEKQLAEKIISLLPSIEKLRFVCSGTEAGMTALRLARGYTERSKILKFNGHYHGHSDSLLVKAGSGVHRINPEATSKGVNPAVLADTISLPYNDFESTRSVLRTEKLAAVILEPVTGNMGVTLPQPGFLEMLREETLKAGTLLIFDEVITGFRVGPQGAQGKYKIDPDLTCLGKIIGGGFPVAAVGGKAAIMDHLAPLGQVYQAGTLSGNPVAMRAGLETFKWIDYEKLEQKMRRLIEPLKNIPLQCAGSMFSLAFEEEAFIQFFHYLFERGIYISPSSQEACFLSMAHTDEQIDFTARQILQFFEERG
jgi:glutamate-1-semialdehyde 2,1-aminomutase